MYTVTICDKGGKMNGFPVKDLKIDMVFFLIERETAFGRSVMVELETGA